MTNKEQAFHSQVEALKTLQEKTKLVTNKEQAFHSQVEALKTLQEKTKLVNDLETQLKQEREALNKAKLDWSNACSMVSEIHGLSVASTTTSAHVLS